jgi:3-hydroxyacyl-CoA dehydrogenase
LKDGAIIASGTSGLSINEISSSLPIEIRKNYYGMHFFNPPYSMPLLELIPNDFCEQERTNELIKYLESDLYRKVIVCKDKPAFVANRIGFHFLNMALQYAEKYSKKGGIDYIDSILGTFTGRAMTPLSTIDFVGLDVHKAIVDNLLKNTSDFENDTFILPKYAELLISEGKLGKKTHGGLYKIEEDDQGIKNKYVFDIESKKYVLKRKYDIDFAREMNQHLSNGDYELAFKCLKNNQSLEAQICKEFLKKYVDYSIFVGKEVCDDMYCADDAMATGFNWCPPLALSNVLFNTNYETNYDFRSFFKAVMK